MDTTKTASHPLTVCTYPEVWLACSEIITVITSPNQMLLHFLDKNPSHPIYFTSKKTSFSLPPCPQIFVLSSVIAMVTCAVFLRLNSLLKLVLLLLAVAVYTYLIHLAFLTLTRHDLLHRSVIEHDALYCHCMTNAVSCHVSQMTS